MFIIFFSNQSDDIDIKNYLLMINTVLSNVLTNTYNCDRFSNELLTNFSDHHIQISLEVTKLLLQSNITSNDWYLNHENPQRNILHHLLFVCIPKGKNICVLKSNMYFSTIYFLYRND